MVWFVKWQNLALLGKSNMFEVNTLNTFLLFCYFFSLCWSCYKKKVSSHARQALVQTSMPSPVRPGQCWHGLRTGVRSLSWLLPVLAGPWGPSEGRRGLCLWGALSLRLVKQVNTLEQCYWSTKESSDYLPERKKQYLGEVGKESFGIGVKEATKWVWKPSRSVSVFSSFIYAFFLSLPFHCFFFLDASSVLSFSCLYPFNFFKLKLYLKSWEEMNNDNIY